MLSFDKNDDTCSTTIQQQLSYTFLKGSLLSIRPHRSARWTRRSGPLAPGYIERWWRWQQPVDRLSTSFLALHAKGNRPTAAAAMVNIHRGLILALVITAVAAAADPRRVSHPLVPSSLEPM